jgi:DnaK suppressor protein
MQTQSNFEGRNHPSRREKLYRMLQQKRQEARRALEAQLGAQIHDTRPQSDVGLDSADQSTRDMAQDLDLSLLEMRDRTFKEINYALQRFADGTYGTCQECGEDVPEGRLLAMPFARHCIDCQSQIELMEKIRRTPDETEA